MRPLTMPISPTLLLAAAGCMGAPGPGQPLRIGTVRSGRKLTACETRTGNPAPG